MKILFVLIGLLASQAVAMWPNSWIVGNTCEVIAGRNFDNCTSQEHECLCTNQNFLSSVVQCLNDNLSKTSQIDKAWDFVLNKRCHSPENFSSDDIYKRSLTYLSQKSTVQLNASTKYTDVFTQPIVGDRTAIRETYTSIYYNLHNRDVGTWQGSVLVMIWVFIIGMSGLYRFIRYISVTFAPKSQSMGRPGWITRNYHKHISIPAAFGHRHIDRYYLFDFIPIFFPTRFESIVISFYTLMTLIFMCTGYKFQHNNPLWATHYSELVLNVSNRAGILASIQIPLLTLFALRNSFLIWISGWSFATFNAYHRAISRVTVLLAIIHAASKHEMMLSFHAPLRLIYYPTMLFRLGVTALVLWTLMILLGFFRVKYYELFLFVHIVGAVASYICILFHLNHVGYKQTIYVSLAMILGDIMFRIGRILFSNTSLFLKPIEGSKRLTKASLSLLPSDVINVRVRTPIHWPFAPGQYVYIHFNRMNIFESHPFSAVGPSSDGESFQLLCKARGGITKRLYDHMLELGANSGEKIEMSVLIEGPYGVHCPVERFDSVLLVAGGIGITGIIPYAEYLALSPQYHEIVLLWTVSSVEELTWIDERLQWLSETGKAKIKLYVTRGGTAPKTKEDTVIEDGVAMTELDKSVIMDPPPSFPRHSYETDQMYLVGEGNTKRYSETGEPGMRRKMSFRKHIKSLSQNSIRVDLDQRMENIDGNEMVDWTDYSTHHHHHLRHNSKNGSLYYAQTPITEEDQSTKHNTASTNTAINTAAQTPVKSSTPLPYQPGYRYSYTPGKRTSAILAQSASTADQKTAPHSINVEEIVPAQSWMSHVIEGGRPNLMETVQEFFRNSSGSVCVVGCGPARMMDTLRRATCVHYDLVENGRLEYYEEAFTW
ncbi:uncharacterized protein SAPINGB_P005265 [Magnusiomyces paraingens]|uniref:ferric-chelate reductase (NADPH) n=1 Tax=Magnusiomyces paraingens TaxID=2606893 RepID=A0A5E8C4M3_9ASCO|nr:uncharacterized protein SAPINGB_P005265 [Saprochaete ingens]VVT56778.1 unnamed protein product [Saprochaete ingens]